MPQYAEIRKSMFISFIIFYNYFFIIYLLLHIFCRVQVTSVEQPVFVQAYVASLEMAGENSQVPVHDSAPPTDAPVINSAFPMELEQALGSSLAYVRDNELGKTSSRQEHEETNSEYVAIELLAPTPTNSELEFSPSGNFILKLCSVAYLKFSYF